MEVVFLGCGPSSSVPSIRCLLAGNCEVCAEAHANPASKNRRLNPSVLVHVPAANVNVLIDCGKTFRDSVLRVFPQISVQTVQAVLLTHGHADACLGLDDLREVQAFDVQIDPVTKECKKLSHEPLSVHCSAFTREEIAAKFDYLMEKPSEQEKDKEKGEVEPVASAPGSTTPAFRWVAQLRVQVFESFQRFSVANGQLQITPLPVIHGGDYIAYGFEFGYEFGVRVVYISDISELTDTTYLYLKSQDAPLDVLVIDALHITKYHSTHLNLSAAIKLIRRLQPRRALLTGMSHDFDYHTTNATLKEYQESEGLVIEMAYDGLRLSFPATEEKQHDG